MPVVAPLTLLVVAAALALSGWAAWFAVTDRAVVLRQLLGAAVVEALLVVQLLVAAVLISTGSPDIEVWELWGYLVTVLLILPFAAAWAFAERSRWSSVVLVVAALTVVFLEWRLVQIWSR